MLKLVPVAFALVLVGCAAPETESMSSAQTESMSTAADQFFGKELVADDGTTFIFFEDGTVGGSFRGEDVTGTYTADATEICSTYTTPEPLTGREFCSTPDVSDGVVVFNRRDGSQSAAYAIKG